jgi:hypothetical protein
MMLVECDRCGGQVPAKKLGQDDEPMSKVRVMGKTGLQQIANASDFEWDLCSGCVLELKDWFVNTVDS